MRELSGHVVIVDGKQHWRPLDISPVVAKFRGVPVADAAREVRRARGILEAGESLADAERMADALVAAGFPARVMPAARVPRLPNSELLRHADPRERGLLCEPRVIPHPDRAEFAVPWNSIDLIAVAPFSTTVYEKSRGEAGPGAGEMVAKVAVAGLTGLPVGLGKRKRQQPRTVSKTEFHLFLDLILDEPPERLRVDASRFDFSGLAADMSYSGIANLKILLAHIVTKAPNALTSPGADLLLQGGRLASLGYDAVEDFEREERWLLATLYE